MGGTQSDQLSYSNSYAGMQHIQRNIESPGPSESEMHPGTTKEDYEEVSRREISRRTYVEDDKIITEVCYEVTYRLK